MDTSEKLKILKERFPLFDYEVVQSKTIEYIKVTLDNGTTTGVGELGDETFQSLQRYHNRIQVRVDFMKKYPNLYPYVNYDGTVDQIWVNRNGRDADAIPHDRPLTGKSLEYWNKKSGEALQPGYFLCNICGEAKPRSEWGYYHFCAEYCKDCLAKNPDVERRARNETYE